MAYGNCDNTLSISNGNCDELEKAKTDSELISADNAFKNNVGISETRVTMSRYHLGTENSRIYKERSSRRSERKARYYSTQAHTGRDQRAINSVRIIPDIKARYEESLFKRSLRTGPGQHSDQDFLSRRRMEVMSNERRMLDARRNQQLTRRQANEIKNERLEQTENNLARQRRDAQRLSYPAEGSGSLNGNERNAKTHNSMALNLSDRKDSESNRLVRNEMRDARIANIRRADTLREEDISLQSFFRRSISAARSSIEREDVGERRLQSTNRSLISVKDYRLRRMENERGTVTRRARIIDNVRKTRIDHQSSERSKDIRQNRQIATRRTETQLELTVPNNRIFNDNRQFNERRVINNNNRLELLETRIHERQLTERQRIAARRNNAAATVYDQRSGENRRYLKDGKTTESHKIENFNEESLVQTDMSRRNSIRGYNTAMNVPERMSIQNRRNSRLNDQENLTSRRRMPDTTGANYRKVIKSEQQYLNRHRLVNPVGERFERQKEERRRSERGIVNVRNVWDYNGSHQLETRMLSSERRLNERKVTNKPRVVSSERTFDERRISNDLPVNERIIYERRSINDRIDARMISRERNLDVSRSMDKRRIDTLSNNRRERSEARIETQTASNDRRLDENMLFRERRMALSERSFDERRATKERQINEHMLPLTLGKKRENKHWSASELRREERKTFDQRRVAEKEVFDEDRSSISRNTDKRDTNTVRGINTRKIPLDASNEYRMNRRKSTTERNVVVSEQRRRSSNERLDERGFVKESRKNERSSFNERRTNDRQPTTRLIDARKIQNNQERRSDREIITSNRREKDTRRIDAFDNIFNIPNEKTVNYDFINGRALQILLILMISMHMIYKAIDAKTEIR